MPKLITSNLACVAALFFVGGCVVHDNNSAPEPSWWPTFMLREQTVQPSGGKVNVNVDPKSWPDDLRGTSPQSSAAVIGGMTAASAAAPIWFDPGPFYNAAAWYHPEPYSRLNGG